MYVHVYVSSCIIQILLYSGEKYNQVNVVYSIYIRQHNFVHYSNGNKLPTVHDLLRKEGICTVTRKTVLVILVQPGEFWWAYCSTTKLPEFNSLLP